MKIFFLSLVVKLDFNVESLLALARAWCTHFRDFAQLNTHTRTHTHTHTYTGEVSRCLAGPVQSGVWRSGPPLPKCGGPDPWVIQTLRIRTQTQILRGSDMLSLRKPISATLQTQRDPGAAQRPGPRDPGAAQRPGPRDPRPSQRPGPRTPGPRSGRDTGTNQEHNH